MKAVLVLFIILTNITHSQEEKFKDRPIIYLKYVDPEKCDYPHNVPYFYSQSDYLNFKYSGTISKDSLVAERYWYELDYDEDSVKRYEKIVVLFGEPKEDFRYIKRASYIRVGLEDFNEETEEYDFQWNIHQVAIDYQTEILQYELQRHPTDAKMFLEIKKPAVELISFLEYLCFFYRNGNQDGTKFRIEEE
jgi:hypothetical protein